MQLIRRRQLTLPAIYVAPVLVLALTACAPFPEVAPATADQGNWPMLQPMDDLLRQADSATAAKAP